MTPLLGFPDHSPYLAWMEHVSPPSFEQLGRKRLIGMHTETSLMSNMTQQLFRRFMPRQREVASVGGLIWDVRTYSPDYFKEFSPAATFTKWAAMEVDEAASIPEGMEELWVPAGRYAVFQPSEQLHGPALFQYIYGVWVSASGEELDGRPHFDWLDPAADPATVSEKERIWVPLKG